MLEKNRKLITLNYLKKSFFNDFVGLIGYICVFYQINEFLGLLFLLKLPKMYDLMHKLKNYLVLDYYFERIYQLLILLS